MSVVAAPLRVARRRTAIVALRCAACRRLESSSASAKVGEATPAATPSATIQPTRKPPAPMAKQGHNPFLMGDEPKEDFFPREFHEQLKQHPKLKDNKFYQRLMDDREKLWGAS